MPFVMLIIIGAAAGFLAARVMKLNTDIPTTVAIGIFGALIGGLALRFLIAALGAAAWRVQRKPSAPRQARAGRLREMQA